MTTTSGSSGTLVTAEMPRAAVDPHLAEAAARSVTAFTADVYRDLAAAAGDGNLVCSPYSVAVALGMAVQGAGGQTRDEVLHALHAESAPAVAAGLNALDGVLATRAGTFAAFGEEPVEIALRTANSLWGRDDVVWEKGFLAELARSFGTGMCQVDYRADPEQAREAINTWVSDQTRHRIPHLVPPGAIDGDTVLTLVNALYLKAPWLEPFVESRTARGPFSRLDSSTVPADLMHGGLFCPHTRGPGWSAALLPYADERLAMTVLVPDAGRFAEVEAALDGEWLAAVFAAMRPGPVAVTIPRWTTRSSLSLQPTLVRLGVRRVFTDDADLAGMTAQEPLRIGAVVHEGFVAVDESGTEAAAATAVMPRAAGLQVEPFELSADRPFLYVIHDNAADDVGRLRTPLFIGRVLDPTR